jgi:hypothetical protein
MHTRQIYQQAPAPPPARECSKALYGESRESIEPFAVVLCALRPHRPIERNAYLKQNNESYRKA